MKNNIEKIAFYAFASICAFFISDCAIAQKSKTVLCPKQTENEFLLLQAQNLRVPRPDTSHITWVKPTRKHIPRLGDVVQIEGITGIIVTKPQTRLGKTGQTQHTGDPRQNGGYVKTWWYYKFLAQGSSCTTRVFSVGADTKIEKFTRLSKY